MDEFREALAEADQHVADAEARMANLRAQIAEFEREGYDASAPREVLEALEADLELMHRNRGVIAQLLEMASRP